MYKHILIKKFSILVILIIFRSNMFLIYNNDQNGNCLTYYLESLSFRYSVVSQYKCILYIYIGQYSVNVVWLSLDIIDEYL